jgi:hypothetical protein
MAAKGYTNLIPEVPVKIDKATFDTDTYNKAIHCGKCDNDTNTYYTYEKTHVYSGWFRSEKQNNQRV